MEFAEKRLELWDLAEAAGSRTSMAMIQGCFMVEVLSGGRR